MPPKWMSDQRCKLLVSFQHICPDADAARVHMLHGHHGRLVEFLHDLQGRVRVIDIVIGELFAVRCSAVVKVPAGASGLR